MLRRIQFWWAVLSRLWNFEKKSGSHDFTTMRNTWLSPRSAIWEYWTSVVACLVWIQCSCGMPHVIRIGKLFTNTQTRIHARLCFNLESCSLFSSCQCGSYCALIFFCFELMSSPFHFHLVMLISQFCLSEGQRVSNKRGVHNCRRLPEKLKLLSPLGDRAMNYCGSVWPLCTLRCLLHFLQPARWLAKSRFIAMLLEGSVLHFKRAGILKSYRIKFRKVASKLHLIQRVKF